jgi:hypothetical protein
MRDSVEPLRSVPGAARPSPWRFTIRQMLLLVFVMAVALVLYREVPDLVRKEVYNDPIPLKITDPNKIHVRQIPYLPGHSFLYRVALPKGKKYDLCAGIASAQQSIPSPIKVARLTEVEAGLKEAVEFRIHGFFTPSASDPTGKSLHIETMRCHNFRNFGGYEQTLQVDIPFSPAVTFVRAPGFKETDTYNSDDEVVLYREFWRDEADEMPRIKDEHSPGRGLVVWIRERPEEDE